MLGKTKDNNNGGAICICVAQDGGPVMSWGICSCTFGFHKMQEIS
jgi:hypothetical protein